MKKNIVLLILVIAAFAACSKGGSGGGTPNVDPSITPAGTNNGSAVTKTIGSAGGTVVSDDGLVELIIPSGALSANTDITIQPITNNIPTGRTSYRFTPNGQQFAKDVTIKFHYEEVDVAATKPEYMQVAYQNADGTWKVVDKVTNDQAANTINALVNHFTDFTQFDILRINPSSLYLKPNENGQFEISYAGMTTDNIISFGTAVLATPAVWKVNGVTNGNSANGTIQSVAPVKVKYTAPASAPQINPVTVSAEISIPFTIDGQRFNKGILTGQAFITGNNYSVLIEHESTIGIGTLEKFLMKDKVSFTVHLVGIKGMVNNIQNSAPTVQKIEESPAGCVTNFTQLGTGTLHVSNSDKVDVMVNPIDKVVYVGGINMQTDQVFPIIHTACPGVTPGTNELPIAFMGMPSFEFNDTGQAQVIDQSVPGYSKLKITITPL